MISTLSQLVAKVESNDFQHALRFEPNWRYATPALIDKCIRAYRPGYMNAVTAKTMLSISYGKYQIMGSVLYELGYAGILADFQNSTTLQDAWFDEFIRQRGINYTLDEIVTNLAKRKKFALRYNGNASVYGDKLLSTYEDSRGK